MSTEKKQTKSVNETNNAAIRVKDETKKKLKKIRDRVNKEDGVNIKDDAIINFLAGFVTDEQIKELQLSSLTWKVEKVRLKTLYSKKNGKVSQEKWDELLHTGALVSFFSEHSRIEFGANNAA